MNKSAHEQAVNSIKRALSGVSEDDDVIELTNAIQEDDESIKKEDLVAHKNILKDIDQTLKSMDEDHCKKSYAEMKKVSDMVDKRKNEDISDSESGISIKSLAIEIAKPRIEKWIAENLQQIIEKEVERAISEVIETQNLPAIIKNHIQFTIEKLIKE